MPTATNATACACRRSPSRWRLYAAWNLRDPSIGAPDQRVVLRGIVLPFPKTAAERQKAGDPAQVHCGALLGSRRLHDSIQQRGGRTGKAALDSARRPRCLASSRRAGMGAKPRSDRSLGNVCWGSGAGPLKGASRGKSGKREPGPGGTTGKPAAASHYAADSLRKSMVGAGVLVSGSVLYPTCPPSMTLLGRRARLA